MSATSPESERFLSIHIPKTAGTTLRHFYGRVFGDNRVYRFYPEDDGLYPISDEARNGNQRSLAILRKLFMSSEFGARIWRYLGNKRSNSRKRSFSEISEDWSMIHGHYRPQEIPDSHKRDANWVTVLRRPQDRVISHYNFWTKHPAAVRNNWFNAAMGIDEFILRPEMTNLMSSYIQGLCLASFSKVGVVEYLEKFLDFFDPLKQIERIKENGWDGTKKVIPSADALDEFLRRNQEDIALYQEALALNGHLKQGGDGGQ